ncbi:Protein of unknown function DUF77 [Syntrophomonas zehnderi OL-4]|uniref:Thiamine-binding protein domain-containing protein n=1 Tax=Syntrophomonas zehnderi OL-4 TaxID=690567 RepID=A0A0E4C8L5_9FIRM|nr:thiamine-binding protein [Syntrophomonas zehnderi]CFX52014.1 Protein of unknown function DUF77 [Syntrophomonas zehnderi OL-4]
MPEANLSLKVLPIVPEDQLYPLVDQVIKMIHDSGLNYMVSPNDTTIEGDLVTLLDLVKKAQELCIAAGAPRVISMITIDYKPDGVSIDEKICSNHS